MNATTVWIAIAGMAVTNVVLRLVPLATVSRLKLPEPFERFLSFVPVTVMATLVAVSVLRPSGEWLPPAANPYLLAAVPTALVYHYSRSFLGTTVAGVLLFLAASALLG